MARTTKQQKQEALESLRKMLLPGTVVYTVNKHTSRSGMTRSLSCYIVEDGEIRWVSCYWIARALGWRVDERREAVKVAGCGMDMGFHLVNTLSYALHGYEPKGGKAKDASARGIPLTPTRRAYRAGYSLVHRWL